MAQCDHCGGQLGRLKSNGGHLVDNCPGAGNNTPATSGQRNVRYHDSDWGAKAFQVNKNVHGQVLGSVWKCKTCGKFGQSPDALAPGTEQHRGVR